MTECYQLFFLGVSEDKSDQKYDIKHGFVKSIVQRIQVIVMHYLSLLVILRLSLVTSFL